MPVVGDRSAQKSTVHPVVRKKSEITREHAENVANPKPSTIPEKGKGESNVSGSPVKQPDSLAQKLSKKPKPKSQQFSPQNSLLTSPKSKSRSKTTSSNDISLTLRSVRDNAVVSSTLVSSGRAKVTGKTVPKPSPKAQPKAESGPSSRHNVTVADRLQNNTVEEGIVS